jgi:RNA polymerase sigma factor (sigma-70 family)
MASGRDTLVDYLCRSLVRPEADEATDAALLDRFIERRDETAFAALVDRHARLVLHVCRRVLGNLHDAEDAFQAAFLVLARKAAAVRPREGLAAWLHGVAHRVALKARSTRARQTRIDEPIAAPLVDPHPTPPTDLAARELLTAVDEEVRRLPVNYRLPVILCCLEGRSLEEGARQLGWSLGSVKGRLERGRARLHDRLVRRGLMLSAALAAVELSPSAGAAAGVLLAPTVRSALAFAAGRTVGEASSGQSAALAQEVVAAMSLARLKVPAALTLATCLLAAGFVASHVPGPPSTPPLPTDGNGNSAGPLARNQLATLPQGAPGGRQPVAGGPLARNQLATLPQGAPGGRQPVAGGPLARNQLATLPQETGPQVQLVAAEDEPVVGDFWALPAEATRKIEVNGRVLDPAGQPCAGAKLYVGYVPRGCDTYPPTHRPAYPLRAISGADGQFRFTFTKAELDERYLDTSRPVVVAMANGFGADWAEISETAPLSLKLVEDLPVEGRILDRDRNPVAGARVVVRQVSGDTPEAQARFLQTGVHEMLNTCRGPLPGQPPQATTSADGRFRLTGVGRNRLIILAIEGPAVPHTALNVFTWPAADALPSRDVNPATFDYASVTPRPIRGVVRDKSTGQPVAGVKISLESGGPTTLTDQNGRYELIGSYRQPTAVVAAEPQRGEPYFAATVRPVDKAVLDPLTADFELIGGIPLRGRVTDQESGKPPKRAVVVYYPLFPNAHSTSLQQCSSVMAAASTSVRPDGSYSLPVLPGPGVVMVAASPRDWYVSALLDERKLAGLFGDGKEHGDGSWLQVTAGGRQDRRQVERYHALALIKPEEGTKSLSVDLTIHAAHAIPGTVVGPDGGAISGVRVIGLNAIGEPETLASPSFTVEGLNPQRPRQLLFHHREKELGKVVIVRGEETEALKVQLEPCGVVSGRIVDSDGKPVPGMTVGFHPRPPMIGMEVMAQTEGEGHFRAALVPRQQYTLSTVRRLLKPIGDLKVESGQTKNLEDVPVN